MQERYEYRVKNPDYKEESFGEKTSRQLKNFGTATLNTFQEILPVTKKPFESGLQMKRPRLPFIDTAMRSQALFRRENFLPERMFNENANRGYTALNRKPQEYNLNIPEDFENYYYNLTNEYDREDFINALKEYYKNILQCSASSLEENDKCKRIHNFFRDKVIGYSHLQKLGGKKSIKNKKRKKTQKINKSQRRK